MSGQNSHIVPRFDEEMPNFSLIVEQTKQFEFLLISQSSRPEMNCVMAVVAEVAGDLRRIGEVMSFNLRKPLLAEEAATGLAGRDELDNVRAFSSAGKIFDHRLFRRLRERHRLL